MTKTPPQFAVTYGRLNFMSDEPGLETLFVGSSDEVKQLASDFITVIPDDLASYKKDIKKWKGTDQLLIVHQDDDSFFFSAVPIAPSMDHTNFSNFVSEFAVKDDNDD
jgi:hypothetical protein